MSDAPPPTPTRSPWEIPLVGLACLAVGVTVGVLSSVWYGGGLRVPTPNELEELCRPNPGVKERKWTHIVLHHSAGPTGNALAFDRLHREERKWKHGLGYDFVIGNGSRSGDGEIEVGHRWSRQMDGAHCKADGMNRRGVGICFVGNFETDRPTQAQIHAGLALVTWLADRFDISESNILGHGQAKGAKTLCPGKRFPIALFRNAAKLKEMPDE
jgi:N-acetylmuramoyl-L-alanine amidase